ncbi:hypothetical protein Tco_1345930, partial [Tanacetum coccineum]
MHPTTLIPYLRFTKIIVDHILTEHTDIPKHLNESYHRVDNDKVVKLIFNSRKRKGLGMRIPKWLLTEEMKQTKHYKVYAGELNIEVLMTLSQPIESMQEMLSTPGAPMPPNPQEQQALLQSIEDYEAQQAVKNVDEHLMDEDIENIVEGNEETNVDKFVEDVLNSQEDPDTRIEPMSHKESLEAEKVVDYMTINEEVEEESAEASLIRKKGKGIVEIKDTPITTPIRSPRTVIDYLHSDKEKLQELTASKPTSSSSKPKTDRSKHIKGAIARMSRRYDYMFRHMKKSFMPRKDMDAIGHTVQATLKEVVPMVVDETTNDSIKKNLPRMVVEGIRLEREKTKADIASMVAEAARKEHERTRAELSLQVTNDVATNVPSQVDSFLQNYMNNHILHVHPTESASSTILDLQQQLYLKMKDDEQARDADLPIWLALKYKYEKSAPHVEPCRVAVVRTRDHKDHHDDDARPEGESSAKRQRTSEHGTYTRGESSSSQAMDESTPSGSGNQEQLEDFDPWFEDQGTDDDEVPSKEVSLELLAEVSGKGT